MFALGRLRFEFSLLEQWRNLPEGDWILISTEINVCRDDRPGFWFDMTLFNLQLFFISIYWVLNDHDDTP